MDSLKAILLLTYVIVLFGENYSEEYFDDLSGKFTTCRLSNDLFWPYNINFWPMMNESTHTNVSIKFFIKNIHMIWHDEFLVWYTSSCDDISNIHEDLSTIWIPDIMSYIVRFYGADTIDHSYFLSTSVMKIRNKDNKYYHYIFLNTHCSTDTSKWPFDSHNYCIVMESLLNNNNYVKLNFSRRTDDLNSYGIKRKCTVNTVYNESMNIFYSTLNNSHGIKKCTKHFKRFSFIYYTIVCIPAVVIPLMGTFTFLMSGERSLRITLLSSFFIFELLYVQFLDMKLSNNGDHLVYLVTLYRNSLILITLSIILNAISDELYKCNTEEFSCDNPVWIKTVLKFFLNKIRMTMLTNFNTERSELLTKKNIEDITLDNRKNENALFWKTLSILLDRLAFIITLVILSIYFFLLIP